MAINRCMIHPNVRVVPAYHELPPSPRPRPAAATADAERWEQGYPTTLDASHSFDVYQLCSPGDLNNFFFKFCIPYKFASLRFIQFCPKGF